LEADVDEAKGGPEDVDWVLAFIKDEVLNELETFHDGKPNKTRCDSNSTPPFHVPKTTAGKNPSGNDTREESKEESELFIEAHWEVRSFCG
jgi:hypothetical protein